jgi:hemerythrin-like domain-containing protein
MPATGTERATMTHEAIRIIHEEHLAISAMLQTLHLVSTRLKAGASAQEFDLMRAMLFYLDEFPEKLHHRKETEVLFRKLRAAAPAAATVLDRLDREHTAGAQAILELEHLLLAYEQLGDGRRQAFVVALDRYVDRYVRHMQAEETEVLPLAAKALSESEWREIDAAFREQPDPLTSRKPSEDYQGLFTKIVNRLPAPIGLGPAV